MQFSLTSWETSVVLLKLGCTTIEQNDNVGVALKIHAFKFSITTQIFIITKHFCFYMQCQI